MHGKPADWKLRRLNLPREGFANQAEFPSETISLEPTNRELYDIIQQLVPKNTPGARSITVIESGTVAHKGNISYSLAEGTDYEKN